MLSVLAQTGVDIHISFIPTSQAELDNAKHGIPSQGAKVDHDI